MVEFENISDISLKENEYCRIHTWQYFLNDSFKIKIPKLMPNVTVPKTEIFNKNILVNDTTCKPTINGSLNVQDFVTVKRSPQCTFWYNLLNAQNQVPDGTVIKCLCVNGNYRDMTIVDCV